MKKENQIVSCISGFLLSCIVTFATQIANSACIWWMHQPTEPEVLYRNKDY